MTSVLCVGQMMLPSLIISCFASCQHSVVVSVSVYVSPSHVTCIHFYICIMISSHNHTAAAAGHGKHSYLCQDTWDVIHRTGSQKAALHLHYIRDPWSGHIHILLRSLHWTQSRDNNVQPTQSSVCSKCTLLWLHQAPSPSPVTVPH